MLIVKRLGYILLAFFVYVLTSAPVLVLVNRGYLPKFVASLYAPLAWLGLYIEWFGILLFRYWLWFSGIV